MPPDRTKALRRARRGPLVFLLVVAALVMAGCQGESAGLDPPGENGSGGGGQLGAETGGSPPLWPLTGLPVEGGSARRGVFVVKVDNTASSAPQLGLGSADLVAEELVEGGLTRLAVFYHSALPDVVGPVRSMRASDIGIVKPASAVLVASGGAKPTLARLTGANIAQLVEGAAGFFRATDRSAPYNLMLRLPQLVMSVDSAPPARPYLPFGSEDDFPAGKRTTSLQAVFSASHTTSWRYEQGKGWTRPGSYAAEGGDFVADNLVVLRVQIIDAGYLDPAGYRVPETVLSGRGEAIVLHENRAVRGSWIKQSRKAPLQLRAGGKELLVPAGRTWVELVPVRTGRVELG